MVYNHKCQCCQACPRYKVSVLHPKVSDSCNLLQAKVGRLERSESALQHLRGKNADVSEEAIEIIVYNKRFSISVDLKVII